MNTLFVVVLLLMSASPELPNYNDLLSLPSYSCELANGEQRLDYSPSLPARPSATFIKNSGELSIVLDNQEEDATIPVFGRRALISGVVLCQRRLDNIRKIVLKVNWVSSALRLLLTR